MCAEAHEVSLRRMAGPVKSPQASAIVVTSATSVWDVNRPALTAAQQRAIRHVAACADGPPVDPSLRVTVNFHPDREVGGLTVMERLSREDRYRSQFETGMSSGGLTAFEGGDRWEWESRIFGGAYDGRPVAERPVYGALDHRGRSVGGSHRFGSCHLRLRRDVTARTTFCYPDSHLDPTDFGASTAFNLTALADAADQSAEPPDLLDDYIEAHVHGHVSLGADTEALVLDPSFRGTAVQAAAESLDCPLEWHMGFRLSVTELDTFRAYRGPQFVELARRIVQDRVLTPRAIGEAARTGEHDPQDLKRVWHILARFGYTGRLTPGAEPRPRP